MHKQQEHSVNNISIRVNNLSKCYQLYNQPSDRLKQFLWRSNCRGEFIRPEIQCFKDTGRICRPYKGLTLHHSHALRGNASSTAPAVRDAERHLLSSRQELRNATLCTNNRNIK